MSLEETLKNSKNLGIVYPKGNIPPKKLRNAKQEYGGFREQDVLFLTDQTVFGSAKRGIVITSDGVYGRLLGEAFRFRFNEISELCPENGSSVKAVRRRYKDLNVRVGYGGFAEELAEVYRIARMALYRKRYDDRDKADDYDIGLTDLPEQTAPLNRTIPDYGATVPDVGYDRTMPLKEEMQKAFEERMEDVKPR